MKRFKDSVKKPGHDWLANNDMFLGQLDFLLEERYPQGSRTVVRTIGAMQHMGVSGLHSPQSILFGSVQRTDWTVSYGYKIGKERKRKFRTAHKSNAEAVDKFRVAEKRARQMKGQELSDDS